MTSLVLVTFGKIGYSSPGVRFVASKSAVLKWGFLRYPTLVLIASPGPAQWLFFLWSFAFLPLFRLLGSGSGLFPVVTSSNLGTKDTGKRRQFLPFGTYSLVHNATHKEPLKRNRKTDAKTIIILSICTPESFHIHYYPQCRPHTWPGKRGMAEWLGVRQAFLRDTHLSLV